MDITIVETNAVLILNFDSGNRAIRRIRSGGGSLANQDSEPGLRPCCFLRTPGLNSCRPKNSPLGGVDLSYELNNQKRIRPLTSPLAPGIPQLPFPTLPISHAPHLDLHEAAFSNPVVSITTLSPIRQLPCASPQRSLAFSIRMRRPLNHRFSCIP